MTLFNIPTDFSKAAVWISWILPRIFNFPNQFSPRPLETVSERAVIHGYNCYHYIPQFLSLPHIAFSVLLSGLLEEQTSPSIFTCVCRTEFRCSEHHFYYLSVDIISLAIIFSLSLLQRLTFVSYIFTVPINTHFISTF